MKLKPVAHDFILHWGEMGSRWGVNRTVSQIHALLFLSETPINAEEIVETLGIARSSVSTSIRELQNRQLIRTVHQLGDRRDYFETITDVWELACTISYERKKREFDPTISLLQTLVNNEGMTQESEEVQRRIRDTLQLMETISIWSEEMHRLSPETLIKIMKLGEKIQKLIRRDNKLST